MTTDQRPAPLVPREADLRGYDFMPFYGAWLRASDFNATCTDAEYRAAVNLWWSSWHQSPPASLPDNDQALCMHADLGRDMRRWNKVKKVAMAGFVLCSDGRWYHEFLSVQAKIQWDARKAAIEKGVKSGASRRLKAANPVRTELEPKSNPDRTELELSPNKGREGKRTIPRFAEFWDSYPETRRVGRGVCEAKWVKGNLHAVADDILAHVRAMKLTEQWQKDGGKFAPSSQTYLNQQRWRDGLPTAAVKRLVI